MENSTEVLLPLSQRAVEVLEPRETEDIVRLLMSTKGNNGKSLSAALGKLRRCLQSHRKRSNYEEDLFVEVISALLLLSKNLKGFHLVQLGVSKRSVAKVRKMMKNHFNGTAAQRVIQKISSEESQNLPSKSTQLPPLSSATSLRVRPNIFVTPDNHWVQLSSTPQMAGTSPSLTLSPTPSTPENVPRPRSFHLNLKIPSPFPSSPFQKNPPSASSNSEATNPSSGSSDSFERLECLVRASSMMPTPTSPGRTVLVETSPGGLTLRDNAIAPLHQNPSRGIESKMKPSMECDQMRRMSNTELLSVGGDGNEHEKAPSSAFSRPLFMSRPQPLVSPFVLSQEEPKKKKKRGCWSSDQTNRLKELVKEYGPKDWKTVSGVLNREFPNSPQKNRTQCSQHWHRVCGDMLAKGPFTIEELTNLRKLAQENTVIKWSEVANGMRKMGFQRSDSQCSYQFKKIQKAEKSPWQEVELRYLGSKIADHGPPLTDEVWLQLSELMKKQRWNQCARDPWTLKRKWKDLMEVRHPVTQNYRSKLQQQSSPLPPQQREITPPDLTTPNRQIPSRKRRTGERDLMTPIEMQTTLPHRQKRIRVLPPGLPSLHEICPENVRRALFQFPPETTPGLKQTRSPFGGVFLESPLPRPLSSPPSSPFTPPNVTIIHDDH